MARAVSPYVEYAAVVTSLCFLLSPLVEVQKVHRSKGETLRDVNPVNLLLMLLNSALWLWYAIFFPVPPAVLCNTIGLTACCYYLASCWFYASRRSEQTWGSAAAASTMLALVAIGLALAYASSSSAHVQQVGYVAMVVNILMYGAPLSVVSRVIVEQCSRPLPPLQCALGLSCSFLWLCVGLARHSMPMIIPNACGVPLAALQLFLLWRYPRRSAGSSRQDPEGPKWTLQPTEMKLVPRKVVPIPSTSKRHDEHPGPRIGSRPWFPSCTGKAVHVCAVFASPSSRKYS